MTDSYKPNIKHYGSDDEENGKEEKNDKHAEYIEQLLREKLKIDEKECPYAHKFIDDEIERVVKLKKGPSMDQKLLDVYHGRPVKVVVKVLVPVNEHPRFNFVGKLLGPKGNNLKQLQENTRCFMNICGRGSMRDREKEEDLRQSLDPKYAHLSDDLHVEISTIASPAEAHSRISNALSEVRKHLIPEYNSPEPDTKVLMSGPTGFIRAVRPNEDRDPIPNRNDVRGPGSRPLLRSANSSKSSVMSLLNKARIAMQESHGYKERYKAEQLAYEEHDPYDPYHEEQESPAYWRSRSDATYKKRKI